MVFKDIERFHEQKEKEKKMKRSLIKDQFIECFFKIHSPEEIKRKFKASLNESESYLPSFNCTYKLRSSSEKVDPQKYIQIISHKEYNYLLVDFDFTIDASKTS